MKRSKSSKPFWATVRQWNDNFFRRMGVEYSIVETSTARVKQFLGDARCIAFEDCDSDYQIASYERDDATIFVISAGDKSIIYKAESQRRPP